MSTIVDMLVVGAGLSGLQAAQRVKAAGLTCVIIEATDRVGGKTLTVPSKRQGPGLNDVGAAWINDTTQSEMCSLFQQYGIDGEIQRAEGISLAQLPDGSAVSFPYGELPLNEEENKTMSQLFFALHNLIEQADLLNPWAGPDATVLDKVTVQQFADQTFQSELVSTFLISVTRGLLGVDSNELSMLYFVHYCKSGTRIEPLLSDRKDGGQYLRARQGMKSISEHMAKDLGIDSIYLSTPVVSIEQSKSREICTITSSTGKVFECRKVIVSIPSTLYSTIEFKPTLPPLKQLLADGNVMGYYSKMIFVFDHPWWQEAGLSGVFDSNEGPISFTRDTSIPADDQWSISCFIVGGSGRQWSQLSATERYQKAWSQFCSVFQSIQTDGGNIVIPAPINRIEQEWSKQEFFRGAPCPVYPPGLLTTSGAALRTPFQNIHFVGTETAIQWTGYMEGAVRSGQRGADEVISALCR